MIFGPLETQTRSIILFVNKTPLVTWSLDYFFIFNVLQESVKNPNVIAALSTDHSPIMFSLFSKSGGTRGKALWKHNNSLCDKSTYIDSKKKHIYLFKVLLK